MVKKALRVSTSNVQYWLPCPPVTDIRIVRPNIELTGPVRWQRYRCVATGNGSGLSRVAKNTAQRSVKVRNPVPPGNERARNHTERSRCPGACRCQGEFSRNQLRNAIVCCGDESYPGSCVSG